MTQSVSTPLIFNLVTYGPERHCLSARVARGRRRPDSELALVKNGWLFRSPNALQFNNSTPAVKQAVALGGLRRLPQNVTRGRQACPISLDLHLLPLDAARVLLLVDRALDRLSPNKSIIDFRSTWLVARRAPEQPHPVTGAPMNSRVGVFQFPLGFKQGAYSRIHAHKHTRTHRTTLRSLPGTSP